MNTITAEDKDKVLRWLYELKVHGKTLPNDYLPKLSDEICLILTNDGYAQFGKNISEITIKGVAFYLNGGYVQAEKDKERTIKVSEEANNIAREANRRSKRANWIAVAALVISTLISCYKCSQEKQVTLIPQQTKSSFGINVRKENAVIDSTLNQKSRIPNKFKKK